MKKLLFSFALMLIALSASAVDFETGMCKYRTTGTDEETGLKTVTCIGLSTSSANSTEVGVPSTVYYNNEHYLVTSIGNAAFNGNKNLTKVILSKGLQSIASAAFGACSNLKEVYLPSTLTYVGNNAFLNCGNSLVIYAAWIDKVPTFGTTVFSNATSYSTTVTRIYVPTRAGRDIVNADATLSALSATVTVDPSKANDGQLTLNSKNFFYVVTKMPTSSADGELSMVGADCADIRTTNLGPLFFVQNSSGRNLLLALTAIAPYAFYGNTSVTSVANVSNTAIGDYAFYNCDKLTSVNIRSGSISQYAFYDCGALYSVVLGNESDSYNLTVSDYAFTNTAIETVTINKNVTRLGTFPYLVFRDTKLKTITVSSGNANYSSYNGMLYNKDQTTLLYVPEYTTHTELSSTTIAPNLKTIAQCAMYTNKTLTSIEIPYGVTSIGASACFNASNIDFVRISSSVTSIGQQAFKGVSSSVAFSLAWLNSSQIPTLGESAFGDGYYKFYLPTSDGVTAARSVLGTQYYYESCWFAYDTRVTSNNNTHYFIVTKAPTTSTPGEMALIGMQGINSELRIDDAHQSNASYQLMRGTAVPNRIYPNEIYKRAFAENTNIRILNINISGNYQIDKIGGEAFADCTNLREANLGKVKELSTEGGQFQNCTSLEKVTLSDKIKSIPKKAFQDTPMLTSFPFDILSLSYIGTLAFASSGLTGDVKLGLLNGQIDDWAFSSCTGLKSLTVFDKDAQHYNELTSAAETNLRFWCNNMASDFRLYVPLYSFYKRVASAYSFSKITGDQLRPFIMGYYDYFSVSFPNVRDNQGELASGLNVISLDNIVKEGGKIYIGGGKTTNPVGSNGVLELVEVDVKKDGNYYYAGAFPDQGYIIKLELGKIYKLERQGSSNLVGVSSNTTYAYNWLRATSSTSTSDGSLVQDILQGATRKIYVCDKIGMYDSPNFVYTRLTSNATVGNKLSTYVDLSDASQSVVPTEVYLRFTTSYDLNNDGKVSTADIQVIINEMKKPADAQNMSYDLNGDGKISTADIQVIINEMKK